MKKRKKKTKTAESEHTLKCHSGKHICFHFCPPSSVCLVEGSLKFIFIYEHNSPGSHWSYFLKNSLLFNLRLSTFSDLCPDLDPRFSVSVFLFWIEFMLIWPSFFSPLGCFPFISTQSLTKGCETSEMTLRRNGLGQLGFHVNYEGIVAEVSLHSDKLTTLPREGFWINPVFDQIWCYVTTRWSRTATPGRRDCDREAD